MKKTAQEELDQILADHRLWLDTLGEKGKRAVLQGADLRGANLLQADLISANLSEADLTEANLQGANLRESNLQGADLRGANLRGANLQGANLRLAGLVGADLYGADLPLSIRDCFAFRSARFSPGALPWLILHPKWSEFKDSVQISAE